MIKISLFLGILEKKNLFYECKENRLIEIIELNHCFCNRCSLSIQQFLLSTKSLPTQTQHVHCTVTWPTVHVLQVGQVCTVASTLMNASHHLVGF